MPADPSNLTRQPDKSNTVAHTPGGFWLNAAYAFACFAVIFTAFISIWGASQQLYNSLIVLMLFVTMAYARQAARQAIQRAEGAEQ